LTNSRSRIPKPILLARLPWKHTPTYENVSHSTFAPFPGAARFPCLTGSRRVWSDSRPLKDEDPGERALGIPQNGSNPIRKMPLKRPAGARANSESTLKTLSKAGPIQAEYEDSIPFTRSNLSN
jgi:hypothetical protein